MTQKETKQIFIDCYCTYIWLFIKNQISCAAAFKGIAVTHYAKREWALTEEMVCWWTTFKKDSITSF